MIMEFIIKSIALLFLIATLIILIVIAIRR